MVSLINRVTGVSMIQDSQSKRVHFLPVENLVGTLRLTRWMIPALMSAMGIAYIVYEHRLHTGDPGWPVPTILGIIILGFIGPAVSWKVLHWVMATAGAFVASQIQLSRRAEELDILNKLAVASSKSLDFNTTLTAILEHTIAALQAGAGMIFIQEQESKALRLETYRGISVAMALEEATLQPGHCLCGQAVKTGQVLIAHDVGQDTRCTSDVCICEGFRSVACAPLHVKGNPVGLIQLASPSAAHFSADQQGFLEAVAAQVSVSIENARLYAKVQSFNLELEQKVNRRTTELEAAQWALAEKARQLQQLLSAAYQVQETTQARIAHDMHDGVTQMVLGALYETQAAKDVIETNPSRAKHNLIRAQQFLTDIDTEIRQVIYDLHPPVLDVMGMVVSLRWFAQSFSKTFNIDCQILVDGEAHRLAKSAEIALYRILQAALQNVAAHAQATQAVVKFDFGRECFKVAVCDDGVGFNPQLVFTTPGEHLGLIGMKERTESIGADLVVNSILGHGTEILVQLPFPQYVD